MKPAAPKGKAAAKAKPAASAKPKAKEKSVAPPAKVKKSAVAAGPAPKAATGPTGPRTKKKGAKAGAGAGADDGPDGIPFAPLKPGDGKAGGAKRNEAEERAVAAARLAEDVKATDVVVLDVRGLCNFADFFVVATGQSNLQMRAIGDRIEKGLVEKGSKPYATEGRGLNSWIVLDFGDVVVHIMSAEARSFYALESLWGDAKIVPHAATGSSAAGVATRSRSANS